GALPDAVHDPFAHAIGYDGDCVARGLQRDRADGRALRDALQTCQQIFRSRARNSLRREHPTERKHAVAVAAAIGICEQLIVLNCVIWEQAWEIPRKAAASGSPSRAGSWSTTCGQAPVSQGPMSSVVSGSAT